MKAMMSSEAARWQVESAWLNRSTLAPEVAVVEAQRILAETEGQIGFPGGFHYNPATVCTPGRRALAESLASLCDMEADRGTSYHGGHFAEYLWEHQVAQAIENMEGM